MPRIQGTTDVQTSFLRAFRKNPFGPPPESWPSPSILRRWLRRPAFRSALLSIRETLRFQSDFHLVAASAQAAHRLTSHSIPTQDSALPTQDSALSPQHSTSFTPQDAYRLLRLHHLHERFHTEPPPPPRPQPKRVPLDKLSPELQNLLTTYNKSRADLEAAGIDTDFLEYGVLEYLDE
jgi:hypothetical protein